jgi:hypothetical protein
MVTTTPTDRPAPAAVVVVDQPDRETRPLAFGVGLTLAGHGALALGVGSWVQTLAAVALGAGAIVTAYGIARVGRAA